MPKIESGLAFNEQECINLIGESWGRFLGEAPSASQAKNVNAPGFFGMTQLRRSMLFKRPLTDPELPEEVGEFPRFQTDIIRQKYEEMVSRCMENQFRVECLPGSPRFKDKERSDKAERIFTYGAADMQSRTQVDWQKALIQGATAFGMGVLHWQMRPEYSAETPDAKYRDEPEVGYLPTEEIVGGDKSKGKYRESAKSVSDRAKLAKSRHPLPYHVEVVAADQIAAIWDESPRPGPGIVVHVKEVGLLDYTGKLMSDGLRIDMVNGSKGPEIAISDTDPKSGMGLERPAPSSSFIEPSYAGWQTRVALAFVWTRDECYELVSPTLLAAGQQDITTSTNWKLVKAYKHGYGCCPFTFAFASVEQGEFDPALRFRPALDGLYQSAPLYNYTRALETVEATQIVLKRYFMTQDPNAPPVLQGDEEGDQVTMTRDSSQAQMLPPGADLKALGPDDLSPAFVRLRELLHQELGEASPPTGVTEITGTTQPWTARLGQAQANSYPAMLLKSVADALAFMFRNWAECARKPVEEGGLGYGLYVPGVTDKRGEFAEPVGLDPEEWDGIWIDVVIDPVSQAERVTGIQLGIQILNNPIPVMTPDQFVSESMGVQDATTHMQEVDAWQASLPWKQRLYQQGLAKKYGSRVVVGAGGVMVDSTGAEQSPVDVLASKGITPVAADKGNSSAPGSTPAMPALPALSAPVTTELPGRV